jgi:hypothetical protein
VSLDIRIATITLTESSDGTILMQTKFDPPLEEWRVESDMLPAVAEAAAVAVGAVGNWSAGLQGGD